MAKGLFSIAMGLAMLTVTGTADAADLVLEKYFSERRRLKAALVPSTASAATSPST